MVLAKSAAHRTRDLVDLIMEAGQLYQGHGLLAVGERFGGVGMEFNQQAVGSGGDGGARRRQHEVGPAGRVAGIGDHRVRRHLLHIGDGVGVERIAGETVKRADAALAEDDPLIIPGS
jgi:hypothetical protein